MDDNILYLLTATYPFGYGEPFLENELKVIAPHFTKVYVVVPVENDKTLPPLHYTVPGNTEVITLRYTLGSFDKAVATFASVFKKQFWQELGIIRNQYGLSINGAILKTLWNYFAQAKAVNAVFKPLLQQHSNKQQFVYTYWCTQYTYASVLLAQQMANCHVVTRIHGWDLYFERSTINYLPLRPYIFRHVKNVFTIAEQGRQYLLNKVGGEFTDKISTQYLGSTRGSLKTGEPRDKTFHLLSIAFVVPVKRLERIVDALKQIRGVRICWHHIGGGAGEEKLKGYAESELQGIPNIETRFYGNKSTAEVATLLASQTFHALINTSESEGLPVTFMEALSYGIPLIAPNVGGIAEIVKHEQNGILLPAAPTTAEISAAITKLALMSEQDYTAWRKNAFDTWQRKFNATTNYNQFAARIIKH